MKHYERYRGCGEKDFCPLVWKTSAIRRGLRDARSGEAGIVYHPKLGICPDQNGDKEDGDDVSVYGDEEKLEQSIFDLMKELQDTFTPIVKVDNQKEDIDTYEIVSMETSPDVDMEDTALTPNKENVVSEDSVESTVRQEKSNYVVEEEDSLLAVSGNSDGPGKKQKFDNEVSDVDSVSSCGNVYLYIIIMSYFHSSSLTISTLQLKQHEQETSPRVTQKRETEVSDKLKTLFSNYHSIEKVELKNTKSPMTTSIYNGVYRDFSNKRSTVFDSKFLDIRLGRFILETDAALVYDSAVRAQALKEHYEKINFATEQDYLEARTKELKNRDKGTDLGLTLSIVINSVKAFREQLASKQEKREDTTETKMVVEEEDAPLVVSGNPTDRQLRPRKKQKLENGASVVDSVST